MFVLILYAGVYEILTEPWELLRVESRIFYLDMMYENYKETHVLRKGLYPSWSYPQLLLVYTVC